MFGSTSRLCFLSLALGASILAMAAVAAGARPAGHGWIPIALMLALGLLQLVPAPPALLRLVSPSAARFRELAWGAAGAAHAARAARAAEDAWRPLSLDPHETLSSLLVLSSACCVFGVVRFTLPHPSVRRLLVGSLVASGTFQAAYGIAEYLSGRQEILGWPKLYYTDCATGTFINRNHFAGYLEMTLMICLGAAISLAGPGGRAIRGALLAISTPRGAVRLLLGAGACVMFPALLLSRSRAGAASCAAGLLVLVSLPERGPARRIAFVSVAGIVIVALVYTFHVSPVSPAERFERVSRDLTGSEGRLPLWRDAARMAAAFPLAGAGLGSFEHVFPAMRTLDSAQLYRHAHNDYIEIAAELGLPGLLLALASAGAFLRRAAPAASRRLGDQGEPIDPLARGAALGGVAAAAALALHSVFDFNLHVPANLLTLSAVAALALPGPGPEPHPLARLRAA